jgi:hypothetical protein
MQSTGMFFVVYLQIQPMKSRIILIISGALVATAMIFCSCTKDEIEFDKDNLLPGVWNFSGTNLNVNVYARAREFTQTHCYKFNADGSLIERNFSGWCGTPPASYSDYQGSWSVVNDTLVNVKVDYWGGKTRYNLDIVSVSADSFKVIWLPANK